MYIVLVLVLVLEIVIAMDYKTERERLLNEIGFNWTNACKKKGSDEMNKCYKSYGICLECWLDSEINKCWDNETGGKDEISTTR
jgi:hypothetical protein